MLRHLESSNFISCNKSKSSALCHACQLGKQIKLPFVSSESNVASIFEIIHSDIWTSPIPSESGIKYYSIFLDHFSHFVWVYPLHKKSDLYENFVTFRAYVNKQFGVDIKALQCDHGVNTTMLAFMTFFAKTGFNFVFLAHTHLNRMANLNACCVPLTTSSEPYFFRLTFPPPIGWKLLTWLLTF